MQIIIIITTALPSRDDIKVNLLCHGDTSNIVRSNADDDDVDGPPQYTPGYQGRQRWFIYLFDGNGSTHPLVYVHTIYHRILPPVLIIPALSPNCYIVDFAQEEEEHFFCCHSLPTSIGVVAEEEEVVAEDGDGQ